MTRCEQLQRKAELLHKAMMRTKGDMQKIWKKHLETIIERINKMSVKELQERV
jgi:hypothetical protein